MNKDKRLQKNTFDKFLTTQNMNLKMENKKSYKINFFLFEGFGSCFRFVQDMATKFNCFFNFVAKYSGDDLVQIYSSEP